MEPEDLTIPEAAERLGVHPESVRRAIRQGRLTASRVGSSKRGAFRISPAAIEEYGAKHLVVLGEDEQTTPLSEDELVGLLERAARRGNVRAATWLLERQWPQRWTTAHTRKKDVSDEQSDEAPADPFSELDQLAPRREARSA